MSLCWVHMPYCWFCYALSHKEVTFDLDVKHHAATFGSHIAVIHFVPCMGMLHILLSQQGLHMKCIGLDKGGYLLNMFLISP